MKPDREFQHLSVLLKESVAPLLTPRASVLVDCTLGGGGHTAALLAGLGAGKVIAFDRDLQMIEAARTRFSAEIAEGRLILVHSDYGNIRSRLLALGVEQVDGILVDAGVSSFQLDQAERGFSFLREGPLDMRMDQTQSFTAYDLVNQYPRQDMEKIFFQYGEEKFSKKIVSRILEAREASPIVNTLQLAKIIENCLPRSGKKKSQIHPATRVFQAIGIAVNDELGALKKLLNEIPFLLKPGGVFSAISFHSLEDRLIKERLKYLTDACVCPPEVITCDRCNKPMGVLMQKKPYVPTEKEMQSNPRSRSAKLRVFIKANSNERRKDYLGRE